MAERKSLGGKIFTWPFIVCLIVVLVAVFFLSKRFMYGIGAVTNMNDGYPWGIWIAYDVVVGTGLACGGYAIALLVYIFHKGEYSPLVRPALLASMFGYTLAGVSVMFDLGRYWQAYNIFLPWYGNLHSIMFEVAWCIGIYAMVLWVEFAPTFLEKFKAKKLQRKLNRVIFVFIAMGLLMPTMHQSSLGTMMLMAGHKLSPLWRTGYLPLLFLISALIMGYAVVIFETTLAGVRFKRPGETDILGKISAIMPWMLALYLVIRVEDVNLRGYLAEALSGGFEGNMFVLENVLHLIPLLILMYPQNRNNPRLLFVSAVLMMLGGSLYRLDTYLIGFDPGNGWQYFPSMPEILITFAIVATEIMGYLWFVKRMPVFTVHKHA